MKKLLAYYTNGNYTVKMFNDGTKIKQSQQDFFDACFPDSIDLKITNYCDMGCPMCHEKSSPDGKHATLDAKFLNTLKPGTELAIGGGNPLSHSKLVCFLQTMKQKNVFCNLTINQNHLFDNEQLIQKLIDNKLIYGLGVSITKYDEKVIEFAQKNKNVVLHLINGVFCDFEKLFNKNLKILILGYKKFGRGEKFFSPLIESQIQKTKKELYSYFDKFECVSFDNLALDQLCVKDIVSNETWENSFMGEDGTSSMYIDLVENKFAKTSTSVERFGMLDDICEMFKKVKTL